MTYALLRVFYGIWVMGAGGFIVLAVGATLFCSKPWRVRGKNLARRFYHSLIWPFAMLSRKGRQALLTDIWEAQ